VLDIPIPGETVRLRRGLAVLVVLVVPRREATGDVSLNTPVLRPRTRIGLPVGLRVGPTIRRDRDRK